MPTAGDTPEGARKPSCRIRASRRSVRLLVDANEVSVAFGPRRILDKASFQLAEGDRAALVGPNGAGKTTILNLITGRLRPDMGDVLVDPRLRFGYMTQTFEFTEGATVASLLAERPAQVENLEAEVHAIEARMADAAFYEEAGYEDVLRHYGELQREVAAMTAKSDMSAAYTLLQDLGMGEIDPERRMRDMSGGQKTRVLLAKALANYRDLDLLMLDEPTNHLDIETVEWLERFLVETYEGALLLVAHDRYLMDNLAERILEVEAMKVWEWPGNFSDHLAQKSAYTAALEARRRREFAEVQRQVSIIEEIKRRNRFDHQARSKERRLDRMRRSADEAFARVKQHEGQSFKLKLATASKSSNDVLRVVDLDKRFGEVEIFRHMELVVGKGDKVGLIGPNGAGKTTLLRMIAGRDEPDRGAVEVSPGVKLGYFDQEHAGLDRERSLIDEIRTVRRMTEEEARGMLGRFLFKGEDAFKKVGTLSGGEKARLSLAKFLVGETNLLVLDEPTNHLDLASQDVVEKALVEYTGALVVVSHDRHFLDAVVNKVAVVAHRRIGVFPGNFSETRTLTRLTEFVGGEGREYVVRKTFRDYEAGKRYTYGERVTITGGETQTVKRLFRLAIERGWLESVEG